MLYVKQLVSGYMWLLCLLDFSGLILCLIKDVALQHIHG